MTSLISALEQLRAERSKAQTQVQKLDQAISAIESLNGSVASRRTGGRTISVDARRKMSLAQKARRARERGSSGTAARKPLLSAPSRREIAVCSVTAMPTALLEKVARVDRPDP